MFRWFAKRNEQQIELLRIRHEIEQMKRDAVARGVLLNEIYNEVKNDGKSTGPTSKA